MTKALLLIVGIATIYAGPYIGQPLYWDTGQGLIYSEDTPPWIALDVTEYTSGRVQCGDLIRLIFPDGQQLVAQALDAGLLYQTSIDLHIDPPIVVDVPTHLAPFDGTSAVRLANISAIQRQLTTFNFQPETWN